MTQGRQQPLQVKARDLLAACKQKVDSVLHQKDVGVGGDVARDLRDHDRLQYQVQTGLRCTFQQPGGGEDTFLVQPYNMSKSGLGMLHGSFVYPGTKCFIELSMPDGKPKWITGAVVRCSFVTGKVHDVGIKFDEVLRQGWYDPAAPKDEGASERSLPSFSGTVLLHTTSKTDRDLARHALGKLGIDVTVVPKLDEAIQLAGKVKHNLAMATVWDGEDGQGLTLVKSLVANGYPFPIIGLIGKSMDDVRTQAVEAGCTDVIESLTDFDALTKVMAKYLTPSLSSAGTGDPLVSTLWPDVSFRPMIVQFLEHLEKTQIPAMQKALAGKDWKELRCICRDLCASGGAYGFDPIVEAAARLAACSKDDGDAAAREPAHADLTALIRRACTSNRSA